MQDYFKHGVLPEPGTICEIDVAAWDPLEPSSEQQGSDVSRRAARSPEHVRLLQAMSNLAQLQARLLPAVRAGKAMGSVSLI